MLKMLSLVILAAFTLADSAFATVIYTYDFLTPVTLAGPLPASAENLVGLNPEIIYGNLGTDLNAVNMFAVLIEQPSIFAATTFPVNHGAPDTELFLFNSSGRAVYANDDIAASDTLSCLPSDAASNPCPFTAGGLGPLSAGVYYLAITRSNQLPWDSANSYLFMNAISSTDVVGPAGSNPIAGWDAGAFADPNFDNSFYAISLVGTVPEPTTLLLISSATIALFLSRRFEIFGRR
jgi:hypothetical protein